jgi:hypothetical protein
MVRRAAGQVSGSHFLLPVADSTKPALRERVYCYELYHQLRCICPALSISAEPDKRGNSAFPAGIKRPNPDLIFHVPGSNDDNLAVVEVENDPTPKHLAKDFGNFRLMKEHLGYSVLILLIYGVSRVSPAKISKEMKLAGFSPRDVVVLHHGGADREPMEVRLENYFEGLRAP